MSLLFWRKTRDVAPDNAQSVAVTETTPLPVQIFTNEDEDTPRVQVDQAYLPPVAGELRIIGPLDIPGIGTGSAYADGDAFGTVFQLAGCFRAEKASGTIVGALLYDLDDEGIQVDFPLFTRSFTGTADNSAFAPTDADLLYCRGVVSVDTFYNWSVNQMGQAGNTTVPRWVKGESADLWTQAVVRGAANIAAGSVPKVAFLVVPD